jgi:hypothetical protein
MVNNKSAFWKALIATLIVFAIGFSVGYYMENTRIGNVEVAILNSEINLMDEQIKSNALQELNLNCTASKESTFTFADRIYTEALKLEEYDSSNKLKKTLTTFHRRYDLLRALLWTESTKIRKKCPDQFHTILYLYEYNSQSINTKAEQLALGRLLLDFKYNYPNQILLIPMASNLNVETINVIMKNYNITESPAIIIDETKVIKQIPTFKELENIVFNSNNK